MKKCLISIISLTLIASCGGSGESDDTLSSGVNSFDLTKIQSTVIGAVYSTPLTGNDSDGKTYSGSLSITNQNKIMLNGVLVTPQQLTFQLTYSGPFSISRLESTGITHFDASNNLISTSTPSGSIICTSISPDAMPSTVNIGDSGTRPTQTCDNNTYKENSWEITSGGNNSIVLSSTTFLKDQTNILISTAIDTYTINNLGEITSLKAVITYSNGYTLTYEST